MTELPYRIVALDLDGTLLSDEHRISERNRQAVLDMHEAGVTVVLASGRMHARVVPFAEELGIVASLISYNGAMLRGSRDAAPLYHAPVPGELAQRVVRRCLGQGLHLNVYVDDVLYVREANAWSDMYHARTGSEIVPHPDLIGLAARGPTKILIVDEPARIEALEPQMRAHFEPPLRVTRSMLEYLEFLHPDALKGKALQALAESMGVPPEQVMAIGDAYNDVDLLEYAGFGVALANAVPEVLAVADYVAPSNQEDGVAHAVYRFVLR